MDYCAIEDPLEDKQYSDLQVLSSQVNDNSSSRHSLTFIYHFEFVLFSSTTQLLKSVRGAL